MRNQEQDLLNYIVQVEETRRLFSWAFIKLLTVTVRNTFYIVF